MSRSKTMIVQTINLSEDVMITLTWPKGHKPNIEWNGDQVFVSLDPLASAPVRASLEDRYGQGLLGKSAGPASNGPEKDTPEIAAQKAKLGDPTRGALPFGAKTADLFDGEDVTGEALEAMAQQFSGAAVV